MRAYLLKRLLSALLVAFIASLVSFALLRLAPGDPAKMLALARFGVNGATPEEIERIRRAERLDAPFVLQYGRWLNRIIHGDLGASFVNRQSVAAEIARRLPVTFALACAGLCAGLLITVPLSLFTSLHPNRWWNGLSDSLAAVSAALPSFWLAHLLVLWLAVHWRWLPVAGYGSFAHLILPAITLGSGFTALLLPTLRAQLHAAMRQDYIRTAQAIGLAPFTIISKYALKNALLPVVAIAATQFTQLLEGAVIVETIFAIPGLGRLLVEAVFDRDVPVLQGCVLTFGGLIALTTLAADGLTLLLDPRVRLQSQERLRA
jgi:peptide/nickel transport system permease protein